MSSKDQIINKAISLVKANFSNSEFANIFGLDYRNACAYIAGRKSFPISLAFDVFDYLDARLVVFRTL